MLKTFTRPERYDPALLNIMQSAFDEACATLSAHDATPEKRELLAKAILAVVDDGERDSATIVRRATANILADLR